MSPIKAQGSPACRAEALWKLKLPQPAVCGEATLTAKYFEHLWLENKVGLYAERVRNAALQRTLSSFTELRLHTTLLLLSLLTMWPKPTHWLFMTCNAFAFTPYWVTIIQRKPSRGAGDWSFKAEGLWWIRALRPELGARVAAESLKDSWFWIFWCCSWN